MRETGIRTYKSQKGERKIGGPGRDRTDDLFHAMEARSQLRHRPTPRKVIDSSYSRLGLAIRSTCSGVGSVRFLLLATVVAPAFIIDPKFPIRLQAMLRFGYGRQPLSSNDIVMKVFPRLVLTLAVSSVALAQSSYPPASQQSAAVSAPANSADLGMLLSKIEQETLGLNTDVGKLRIEKWKADSASKYQATENAASIQRSITSALPGLIAAVRSAPQSLASNFKLYRTINALYDVLASLGESAGAFGKREEYETLAPHMAALDDSRRSYGDLLQQMVAAADNRIALAQQAQAAAAVQQPPKKIVVDDTEPAPAPPAKKSKKKKSASASSSATSSPK
jgi:hypothetical protein